MLLSLNYNRRVTNFAWNDHLHDRHDPVQNQQIWNIEAQEGKNKVHFEGDVERLIKVADEVDILEAFKVRIIGDLELVVFLLVLKVLLHRLPVYLVHHCLGGLEMLLRLDHY